MTCLAVLPGAASADDIDAPYARAAAKVSIDARLLHAKNVEAVTLGTGSAGVYCVRVSSAAVPDLSTAAVVASLGTRGQISTIDAPHAFCNNAANTVTVLTHNDQGIFADKAFTLAVL
ncbi:hypothetical protein ACIQV3_37855 [Streptomyces sp. NPDC099050]|uniref:hypothetical protein n=1 Tax=Streptomyces sp. NPDC099050 TaxID=3366100 RepID=UPI003810C586